jgi:hypothetical protein
MSGDAEMPTIVSAWETPLSILDEETRICRLMPCTGAGSAPGLSRCRASTPPFGYIGLPMIAATPHLWGVAGRISAGRPERDLAQLLASTRHAHSRRQYANSAHAEGGGADEPRALSRRRSHSRSDGNEDHPGDHRRLLLRDIRFRYERAQNDCPELSHSPTKSAAMSVLSRRLNGE